MILPIFFTISAFDFIILIPEIYKYFASLLNTHFHFMLLSRKFSLDIEPHPIREEDFNINNALAYEIMKTGLEIKLH